MAFGNMRTARSERYRDLAVLVNYGEYDGEWTLWFEERWLKPQIRELGFEHIRFFGGRRCEYDGSFRQRICELKRPGRAVEYFMYG